MKISVESYGKKYTVECENDDLTMEEYIDILNNILLSIGFAQETILDGLDEFIKEKQL